MKKSMKAIIASVAVVSLACIGGISYAAWTVGGVSSVSVTGTTGIISSISGVKADPKYGGTLGEDGKYAMDKLIPIDHSGSVTGAVKYWQFELSCEATGIESINYTVSGTLTKVPTSGGSTFDSVGLYWSESVPNAQTAGYDITKSTATIAPETDGTKVVYIFLKSNTVDAMNATISVTFGAVEGSN